MLSTFRTLGDALKFFTGLKKQQSAQNTHRHTCPRHSPPFPPSTVQQARVADPELLSSIVAGTYTSRPAWPGALVSFSPSEQSCMCPCSVSLLPFHLQVTEGPQKSDPSLLGLIIPLDPQNTWCCCGVTKHPLPALGVCQSLKAQNKLSTLQRNSRKSWRCGKDRGTQPQCGPVHFQKCHQALLLS